MHARRLALVHADGTRVGARGHPAVFGFYANKQITTGEGGMITLAGPERKSRIDSERNQGRAPDMGWLDHDRLGFNYRLSDIACAVGLAQLQRLAAMLAGARARRRPLPPGARRREGLSLPCPDHGGDRRGWFVFVVQLPAGVDRDDTIRELAAAGIQSKPYLPAIHLMSFYRERFGHREGEFPVCEDVAARSLALPFFPEMSEGQVDRVCERARWPPSAPERARRAADVNWSALSRFHEPQHPDFQRLNASIDFDRRLWPQDLAQSRAHARDARRPGDHHDRGSRRPARGPRRGRAGAPRGRVPVPAPTTRTSTWRSSGG